MRFSRYLTAIDSHTEPIPDVPAGARERTRNVLDRFAIDWSLCMYCGICVDECPFDALEWDAAPTAAGRSLLEEFVAPSPTPHPHLSGDPPPIAGGRPDKWGMRTRRS